MSGMAFGQREAKLVWETTVDRLPYYFPLSYASNGGFIEVSNLLGNTVLFYPDKSRSTPNAVIVKAYNKEGKLMWKNSDFYKNKDGVTYPSSMNSRFVAFYCNTSCQGDSTILFDKDYNYSRSFKGYARPTNDGVLYTDFREYERYLIKYDEKCRPI